MKRKKSGANKAATIQKRIVASSKLPTNCSLCLNNESPAYDCPQFLLIDLENAFGCSLKEIEKNKFKICVTCAYHINILANFVNKNICLSGSNPMCFMCKNFAIFDILPNDLMDLLKNTPFKPQLEDKGNYYACVVCLYQLMKYQNYKNLIDNFRNLCGTSTTNTVIPLQSVVGKNDNMTATTLSLAVPTTKTKNGPTVLLQKLDLSKFKLTPFGMLSSNNLDKFDVSSSEIGRKRTRGSDPIYTEVLPKKRRYDPSPVSSESSDENDDEYLVSESRRPAKKTGKRVTINTRPSVMKAPLEATKTPMKSALKTPPKSATNTTKSEGKFQIKIPLRSQKSRKGTVEATKGSARLGRPPKSPINVSSTPTKTTTIAKTASPDKSIEPTSTTEKTPTPRKSTARSLRTSLKSSPRLSLKMEIKKSPKSEVLDIDNDLDESIPETPTSGRKKRSVTKNFPLKTAAEKKQMDTIQISDDEHDEVKDGSDVVEIGCDENDDIADEPSPDKITNLIDDQEEDDQAEIIIPEDTDNMEKITMDDDSEPNQGDELNKDKCVESENEMLNEVEKIVEPGPSLNALENINDKTDLLNPVVDETVAEIDEYLKSTIRDDPKSDLEAESTSSAVNAPAATTTTSNGNSNSDKENTIDLLPDESNSSDFGVIKKLNNNERVQLDINMDKIFDELRTEATP